MMGKKKEVMGEQMKIKESHAKFIKMPQFNPTSVYCVQGITLVFLVMPR